MVRFTATEGDRLSLRAGQFKNGASSFETPIFMPIVNIITGSPPIFANGGIWRHIKIGLLKEEKYPAIMSQILHFTDFTIDEKRLNKWFEKPIPSRIYDESEYSPFIFVDSGGYRLLYNTSLNIEKFGFKATVKDILTLQSKFGANAVASLDYPLPPGLNDVEARERIKLSIRNCVKTAKLSEDIVGSDTIVYMCAHGRNYDEAYSTIQSLFKNLERGNLKRVPFGVAIGSLVPLASSPKQVIDIVRGVVDGIASCEWADRSQIPVHAFGVSSRMMPVLSALGVDTFDGTTYVQQAQTLRYRKPQSQSYTSFLDLDKIECKCRYCRVLAKEDLEDTKKVLRRRGVGSISFGGKETTKSYIYALIALHNLQGTTDLATLIRKSVGSDRHFKELIALSSTDLKMRKTWAYLAKHNPEISQILWDLGCSSAISRSQPERNSRRSKAQQPRSKPEGSDLESRVREKEVSLALGPDDFNINKVRYSPVSQKIMLILPCSQQKPYSSSPTHRFVQRVFNEAGIDHNAYVKFTLSGNYGLVPFTHEDRPEICSYDFHLSSRDSERIALLAERTRTFLERHASEFESIIAYCTAKPYREVCRLALDGIQNAVILPSPLRVQKASQFRKQENVAQLVREMRNAGA